VAQHNRDGPTVREPHASLPWRGRSLARIDEVSRSIETRRAPHWSDWWIYGVLPLAVLHAALFFTLQARPGQVAVVLWHWGPPAVITATAALLLVALASALHSRLTFSWRRAAGLAGLCVLIGTIGVYRTFPSAHDSKPSAVHFMLPLDGAVTVAWGGGTPAVNYHVSLPAERWAYDLLIAVDGRSYAGDGRTIEDYYAYAKPVRAPAAGRVVGVHDGDPEALPGRADRNRGGGNRVVMEVAPSQYLFIAHLRAGSIRVAPDQWISQGEIIGAVGNSGNSSEPHVHVHLQDTPTTDVGQGIPFYFSHYVSADGVPVERGMPIGGIRRGRFTGEVVSSN
jgi:murein DD-endopeptidase MepM/ murein hydrolase activator NlpD